MQVAHRAAPELAGVLRSFVGYQHDGLQPGEHLGMPSTTLTFVLSTDDPIDVAFGGRRRRYDVVVGGLHTSAATIHHGARQRGIQLAIDPLASRALLGVPASELAESVIDLDELWGDRAARLRDAAGSADCLADQCAAVAGLLSRDDVDGVRREVTIAWRLILRSGGRIGVQQLADSVGWSRRHLEQEFRRELGITPKQACRLRRFEHALSLVRNDAPLAEAAVRAGFADQPHLTRDWRALTGTTPRGWRQSDRLAFVQDSANALRHSESHD
ncbi:helix-turn-helix domain-containing protein [Blastococcus sp. Marseille-P5729]|uniref:AraC family transcriptional regulator n=1 Tax=Blastococcus sp. Marseille-P5729 TaxID=2086582 RepID=UPI000D108666|nr:helix-turn-helix domain-containing protein [Blastococcus sp. Marseille-P5729]